MKLRSKIEHPNLVYFGCCMNIMQILHIKRPTQNSFMRDEYDLESSSGMIATMCHE